MKTCKLIVMLTMLLGINRSAHGQNPRPHFLDSLKKAAATAKTDTGRVSALTEIGFYYVDAVNDKLDSSEYFLKLATELNKKHFVAKFQNKIDLCYALIYCFKNPDADAKKRFLPVIANCQQTGDKLNESMAWNYLPYFLGHSPTLYSFSLVCYEHALRLTHQLGDVDAERYARMEIANAHINLKQYDLAITEFLRIINGKLRASPRDLIFANASLATTYIRKTEYNKALYYALECNKIIEATGDTLVLSSPYRNLADIYRYLGNYPVSLQWTKKSLNHSIGVKDFKFIFVLINQTVVAYLKCKQPKEALKFLLTITTKYKPVKWQDKRDTYLSFGEIYDALKNYSLAEKYYLQMIKLTKEGGADYFDLYKANPYRVLGTFYLRQKRYTEAKKYLSISLKYLS